MNKIQHTKVKSTYPGILDYYILLLQHRHPGVLSRRVHDHGFPNLMRHEASRDGDL